MAEEKERESETIEPYYNCSECSSPIEIIFFDDLNICFNCFNKNNPHKIILPIKEYINKMKIQYKVTNKEKCMINKHNKMNECYCLECNMHLCEICLKSREHLFHKKINIKEIIPKENELNNIDKIILDTKNQDLKNLYEIIFNTYNNYNYNYYYCINLNYLLNKYIKNNKSIKERLNKEEYENIIKIQNIKKEKNENYAGGALDGSENNKINYKKEIINLKEDIDNYIKEISNIKEDNIKISEEIKKLEYLPKNENIIKNITNIINNITNKNTIKALLDIKLDEIGNNIILFNTDIKDGIDVYLNNKKIKMIKDKKSWKIENNFDKDGKYEFEIVFNSIITDMNGFFKEYYYIIFLDLSNFNTSNVTDMSYMFNESLN